MKVSLKSQLEAVITDIVQGVYDVPVQVRLSRPEPQFGDYATNVALQIAKPAGVNPRQAAEMLVTALKAEPALAAQVSEVFIAGPGFINLRLTDRALTDLAGETVAQTLAGKTVVTEYSDPNPFKVLHVGHLYTSIVGYSISSLLEAAGATVYRTNFGGDVGLHVGKTMWAIMQGLGGEKPEGLTAAAGQARSEWMAAAYVKGTKAYEEDESAKQAIIELNRRVYKLHADSDHETPFAQIYWTCRQWSYDYFDSFYERIHTPFDKYYPESTTAPLGIQTVRQQLDKGVYETSDGAVVFKGEPYGLHTRVFINSNGLPTYETKDVGLLMCKWNDYNFDYSVVITGNDITEYMKVVLNSVEQFEPELVARSKHVSHGNVKLAGGAKMSSRKGNFLKAIDVIDLVTEIGQTVNPANSDESVLGAIKYAFLKQRIGADIIFMPEESVSIEGNSGPYLQYAHARARSILRKAADATSPVVKSELASDSEPAFQPDERTLLAKISEYHEAVDKAVEDLMPHHICTYLYELAQTFNRFYENNHVVGDPRETLRLKLVGQYADTLKQGLTLLGITAPDKM